MVALAFAAGHVSAAGFALQENSGSGLGNAYAGTKAFVRQFSLALRADLNSRNVRVTVIEPGMAETEFSEVRLKDAAKATTLYSIQVPQRGGDTLFANMYLAFDALSSGLKELLQELKAVNSSAKADVTKTREDRIKDALTVLSKKELVAEHPVVRTHPETGRKALYVNVAHTSHFKHMTEEESAPILNFLFQHQVRPEFTCRFQWRPGSIALWDNRAALHFPVNDYHGFKRVMHRITLQGDRPR